MPAFIFGGFEHSMANIFYFATAISLYFKVIVFNITVILINSVGGMFFELLTITFKKNKKSEATE